MINEKRTTTKITYNTNHEEVTIDAGPDVIIKMTGPRINIELAKDARDVRVDVVEI